ncbi:MAG: Polyferredoxin protein MvhB [Candidatus Bathyarchaeota archaeon BA1]|nr:MAG: Polyferredoxin protein MvhB [Candidatus Bathyarchaeota archaeon BA1]
MSVKEVFWIARDYMKCSGCRRCEIACSLFHEGKIWPEASRIRVFMLVPGAEIPHFCAQCHDYPCVKSCPEKALSVSKETEAVLVYKEKCTGCGLCIVACPGRIPHLHPTENYALICDLCGGEPQCVKACNRGQFNALWIVKKQETYSYKLYAKRPEETTRDLVLNLYGEKGKEWI